ncbi:MAG: riboflavin biosynthesis protein RibF [Planctomycetes bacterium]|nr:riboflavin biosynthesis protein RibF [Planctomycetota bacterium]
MLRLDGSGEERAPRPCAVTIGMFDGVHRGHLAVLEVLGAHAASRGLDRAVITFRAHPKAVTLGHAPPSITSFEHRLALLERAGVDLVLALEFDAALRATDPEQFLRHFVVDRLRARSLVLGWDSKFGRDRAGNLESIVPLARELGLELQSVGAVSLQGRPVSSTAIREAISLGDLLGAREMLGRDPSLYGQVVPGARRGRELGFPTANLALDHELKPPSGVYAVRALLRDPALGNETWRPGVMNLGERPTFARDAEATCEVHLLDFSGDLYGRWIEVAIVRRLRDIQRFASIDELRSAIAADAAAARAILG